MWVFYVDSNLRCLVGIRKGGILSSRFEVGVGGR